MLAKLGRGGAERVTLALLRSPIPIGMEEEAARGAWRSAIEIRNPDAVREIKLETKQLEWGKLLAIRAGQRIAELTGWGGYQLYEVTGSFADGAANCHFALRRTEIHRSAIRRSDRRRGSARARPSRRRRTRQTYQTSAA